MPPDRSFPSLTPLAGILDDLMELTVAPSWSRLGYAARRRLHHWDADPPARLDGRTVVLTGFTSGIGLAAAGQLAALGADLHLVGRSEEKVRDRSAALRARGARVTTSIADLSDLDAVRGVASEVTEAHDRVDVLAHNAGALLHEWTPSFQGIETTVATHVLGPYLLTTLLVPALEASGPGARVLTMSSGGMYAEKLSVDELEMAPGDYEGARAYARAKRAQVELVPEWRRRHPGIAFHALHPGWADTPGVVTGLPRFHALTRPVLRTPDEGADTLVWLAGASAPDLRDSGGFWLDRRRRPTDKVPWTRADPAERARLWDWCRRRTGLADSG
jgi:dehydrogenase/reductase SDR family member 12